MIETGSPVRVLRIIARLNVGGPAIQAINLTKRLTPLGYDTVLLRGDLSPGEGPMDHLADELGVRPISLPGLRRELGVHDLRALWEAMRWMRRFRPHIVHTHTAKAGAIGRLAAALVLRPRPVVVHTFHGHVFQGEFSPRISRLFALLERHLAKRSTRIITVSDEVRHDLIALGVAPPENIEVIRLGFDLTRFARDRAERAVIRHRTRARLKIPQDARVVSVIARVVKVKRLDRFIDMASTLPADVWFVVVGDGDRREELAKTDLARSLGKRLVWAGFQHDIPAICFASDVVALTSDNEGTPVCLIEAQAAGVPVVGTRVGGVETVVLDGETGFVVGRDARSLAAAVQRLLDDPALGERFGQRGRDHSLRLFSVERLVADIDRLYRTLLASAEDPPSATGHGVR
jgi:glycosyltransferase involved in cell wall biosynthesis